MIVLKPRQFVNRGSILTSGFIISWDAAGMIEARRRILELWQPGLQLKRTGAAFIVVLPEATRVTAGQTIGEPLVRHGQSLIALPLKPAESSALSALPASLVFAQAGCVQIIPFEELADEDITQWIDADSAQVAEVISLGPRPVKPAFEVHAFDVRNAAGVPPASPQLQQLLAELRRQPADSQSAMPRAGFWKRFLVGIPMVFKLLLERVSLISFWRKRAAQPGVKVSSHTQRVFKGKREVGINQAWEWLKGHAYRFLNFTGLLRLMNLRHANYLSRMVAMFQSGNIGDGLRHAIPLADAAELEKKNKKWSWFSVPRPRTNLSINPKRPPATSSWALGVNTYDFLRNLYREIFQRLEAQGRVEEAAFVLTELLASHAEAVSLLERNLRFHLAAEIAEAKQLSPAMAIRLWWKAREPQLALALALRTGEFEQAIQQLAGADPEEANKLRLAWAEILASSGKYIAAAEAIWPVNTNRHLALAWWNQAIELGGTAGSIALARKAARLPECFSEVSPQVERLLSDESDELARGRWAFAENLCRELRSPESQALARLAARTLVRDVQQGMIQVSPPQLRSLLDYTADSSLRVDVPAVASMKTDQSALPLAPPVEIAAPDVGHHSIADVALLPNGGLLLALGEAGLLFLSRDGRPVAHVNQPANKLVVADDGSRAIGIASRGPISRLVRVDVRAHAASYWCDAEISQYTPDFDGTLWHIANGHDVFLIDTLAKGFEVLWRIPDFEGNVRAMQRNRKNHRLYVLTESGKYMTLWDFEQASCRLKSKREIDPDLSQLVPQSTETVKVALQATAITEEGEIFEQLIMTTPPSGPTKTVASKVTICKVKADPTGSRHEVSENVKCGTLSEAAVHSRWLAIPAWHKGSVEVYLLDVNVCAAQLWLRLHGVNKIALRFTEHALLCADDRGRVVVLDLNTGRALRDLRV